MREHDIEKELIGWMEENLHYEPGTVVDVEENLLDEEIMDSIAFMELIIFCEDTFGIQLPLDDILPENFSSVRRISKLISGLVS